MSFCDDGAVRGFEIASDSMLATCGVLLCLFVWLVASQKKRGLS